MIDVNFGMDSRNSIVNMLEMVLQGLTTLLFTLFLWKIIKSGHCTLLFLKSKDLPDYFYVSRTPVFVKTPFVTLDGI